MKRAGAAVENLSMFDPFKTLNLNKKFTIDMKVLDKKYFEAQKKVHPDGFMAANQDIRKAAVNKAGEVNKAYSVLKDPIKRATFLLKLMGIRPLTHDPVFLGEVMNWNERLEAGEDLSQELNLQRDELLRSLEESFNKEDLRTANISLYRLTYVRNLLVDLGKK